MRLDEKVRRRVKTRSVTRGRFAFYAAVNCLGGQCSRSRPETANCAILRFTAFDYEECAD